MYGIKLIKGTRSVFNFVQSSLEGQPRPTRLVAPRRWSRTESMAVQIHLCSSPPAPVVGDTEGSGPLCW